MERHDHVAKELHNIATEELNLSGLLEQNLTPTDGYEEDRIDVVISIGHDEFNIDVAICSPYSITPEVNFARASIDGHAATTTELRKKRRYPNHNVVPFVVEDFGRPGKTAISMVRTLAAQQNAMSKSQAITHIWQCIQAIVQGYTAQNITKAQTKH